jgi:hypothetical protein
MQEQMNKQGEFIRKLWKDENLKKEFIKNPKAVMEKEFGVKIPDDYQIEVVEDTKDKHYFVIPLNPASFGTELDDAQLEQVAGGTFVLVLPVVPSVVTTTVTVCR